MEGERCLDGRGRFCRHECYPLQRSFPRLHKIENKRSGSYCYRVQGERVVPADAGANIPGRYVG